MEIKKKVLSKLLDSMQKLVNRSYEKNGLTDEVLDSQVKINELRNKYNIPDSEEIVTDDGFVQ